MARFQVVMFVGVVLLSLLSFSNAYYVPPNGYRPYPPSSTSTASLPTITTIAQPQPSSSTDTTSDTALATSIIPTSTGTPSTGSTYTGDITHYEVGLGSCGTTNTDSQAVVALSVAMMANGANPNANPKCQTTITLVNPTTGSHSQASVVDTCQACAYEDVDLSPSLFTTLAPTGNGRVHGIQWSFDS